MHCQHLCDFKVSRQIMLLLAILLMLGQASSSSATTSNFGVTGDVMAAAFPTAVEQNYGIISPLCISDSRRYWAAFVNRERWALSMYEASGKLLAGAGDLKTLVNTIASPGIFDQCVHQAVPATGINETSSFRSQFCTVFFSREPVLPSELDDEKGLQLKRPKVRPAGLMPSPYTDLRASFCLPSSCSSRDLSFAVGHLVGMKAIQGPKGKFSLVTMSGDSFCYTKDKIRSYQTHYDDLDVAYAAIMGLLVLLAISASFLKRWKGSGCKILSCFSAVDNTRRIFSTESSREDLGCLHGIRVLSTIWIVVYHCYMCASTNFPGPNLVWATKSVHHWTILQLFNNGFLAVETFFLMTGILITRSLLTTLDKNRFNPVLFYLRRYFRLTPVYAAFYGLFGTLLAHCGSGAYWENVLGMKDHCRTRWVSSFLYTNNLKPENKGCIWQGWYLGADMQLFLFSPLFIYPLWRWRISSVGFHWVLWTAVAFIVAKVVVHIQWNLPPAYISFMRPYDTTQPPYYLAGYYFQAWTHLPQYLIGILIGWLLHQGHLSRLNKVTVVACWTACLALIAMVVYGLVPYLDDSKEIPQFIKVAYGSFHQVAWVLAVGWIVFACTNGYGGFVDEFLSWKAFMPLARLSYGVFLVHYNLMRVYYYAGSSQIHRYFTLLDPIALLDYVALVVVSFGLAFVFSVLVEMPFLNLSQIFLADGKTQAKKKE